MDRQTITHAGCVTARMITAQHDVYFVKFIAGKDAFCVCGSVPFYIGPDILFASPSIASRSRTNTWTTYFELAELHDKSCHWRLQTGFQNQPDVSSLLLHVYGKITEHIND